MIQENLMSTQQKVTIANVNILYQLKYFWYCAVTKYFVLALIVSVALFVLHIDKIASTMSTTVDTTKSVAASAFDKGVSLVGSAKGIFVRSHLIFSNLYIFIVCVIHIATNSVR